MLIMIGVQFIIAGLQANLIAANRKILEDVQYRVRRIDYDRSGQSSDLDKNEKESTSNNKEQI